MPFMIVPSTQKLSTAEGIMPSKHFFQSIQPFSVSSLAGTGGKYTEQARQFVKEKAPKHLDTYCPHQRFHFLRLELIC